jgi:hypothetical protein
VTALLGIPLTLALVFFLGVPLARKLAPGLPRDLEVACGLGLGAGVLGLWCLALAMLRAQTPVAALAVLGLLPVLGKPRLPRRRALLAPIAWFMVAALGLILLQPVPRGASWTNDWAWHFIADQRYADRAGFGEPTLWNGWPLLGRPPLFNLARLPAELLLGQSYSVAEAATVALACVLPAGAWTLLRELAPFARARRALWLLPASAWWIHFGAYPKPTPMATGLALASLGIVLRLRRRQDPALLPLAAVLGALALMTHPAGAFALGPAAVAAFLVGRRRLLAAGLTLAIVLPWPIWANHVAFRGLASMDPVRSYAGSAPLGRGLQSLASLAFNLTASTIPSPLLGHGWAVATGAAKARAVGDLDVFLDAVLSPLVGAIGVSALVVLARGPRSIPLVRPRAFAAALVAAAAIVLVGAIRLVQPDALAAPLQEYDGVLMDPRPVMFASFLVVAALVGASVVLARARPTPGRGADLVVVCAIFGVAVGAVIHERADLHGIAQAALPTPCAIAALAAWTALVDSRLRRAFVAGGVVSLLALGLASALDALPEDHQLELARAFGFQGLGTALGPVAWAGVALIGATSARALHALEAKPGRAP